MQRTNPLIGANNENGHGGTSFQFELLSLVASQESHVRKYVEKDFVQLLLANRLLLLDNLYEEIKMVNWEYFAMG